MIIYNTMSEQERIKKLMELLKEKKIERTQVKRGRPKKGGVLPDIYNKEHVRDPETGYIFGGARYISENEREMIKRGKEKGKEMQKGYVPYSGALYMGGMSEKRKKNAKKFFKDFAKGFKLGFNKTMEIGLPILKAVMPGMGINEGGEFNEEDYGGGIKNKAVQKYIKILDFIKQKKGGKLQMADLIKEGLKFIFSNVFKRNPEIYSGGAIVRKPELKKAILPLIKNVIKTYKEGKQGGKINIAKIMIPTREIHKILNPIAKKVFNKKGGLTKGQYNKLIKANSKKINMLDDVLTGTTKMTNAKIRKMINHENVEQKYLMADLEKKSKAKKRIANPTLAKWREFVKMNMSEGETYSHAIRKIGKNSPAWLEYKEKN